MYGGGVYTASNSISFARSLPSGLQGREGKANNHVRNFKRIGTIAISGRDKMNPFGYQKQTNCWKYQERLEHRLDAADNDRRRIKGNADVHGGRLIDLECKVNKLLEGKKNGKKHKH